MCCNCVCCVHCDVALCDSICAFMGIGIYLYISKCNLGSDNLSKWQMLLIHSTGINCVCKMYLYAKWVRACRSRIRISFLRQRGAWLDIIELV